MTTMHRSTPLRTAAWLLALTLLVPAFAVVADDGSTIGTASPAGSAMPMASPAGSLGSLASLVGTWRASTPEGEAQVTYELMADGSALVERMTTGHGSMLTVYHRDGDRLALTHYCALHNQPRMETAARAVDGKRVKFEFAGVSNLASADAAHMSGLEIEFVDADHFNATWTLSQNGTTTPSTFSYERVR